MSRKILALEFSQDQFDFSKEEQVKNILTHAFIYSSHKSKFPQSRRLFFLDLIFHSYPTPKFRAGEARIFREGMVICFFLIHRPSICKGNGDFSAICKGKVGAAFCNTNLCERLSAFPLRVVD